ncbi:MAG TPA: hypothetical protein VKB09_02690, partial [Thermomicrobiales bacterium]|nr:hypothetical protein [Thermomicrobiales bacterium]
CSNLHATSRTDGDAASDRCATDVGRDSDLHPSADSASAPDCRAYPDTDGNDALGSARADGNNGAVTHGDTTGHSASYP